MAFARCLSMALGICGLGGLIYGAIVDPPRPSSNILRAGLAGLALVYGAADVCYAALTSTAFLLRTNPQLAFVVIGAAALGLLFIGIHNAWDTVTHVLISSFDDTTRTD